MTEATTPTWACPKDGALMERRWSRGGAWRCPTCRGVFLDVEAMRRDRRENRPPAWMPIVWSIAMSVGMTLLVRRLRRRGEQPATVTASEPA